ncbi:MAG TPA: hypothetical protein VKB49_29295, partial [Candidatus Sulfotelmatobacter sp.]|nr:hypothetical protein [Candidatus Sulfotelmatobacter sp.]
MAAIDYARNGMAEKESLSSTFHGLSKNKWANWSILWPSIMWHIDTATALRECDLHAVMKGAPLAVNGNCGSERPYASFLHKHVSAVSSGRRGRWR